MSKNILFAKSYYVTITIIANSPTFIIPIFLFCIPCPCKHVQYILIYLLTFLFKLLLCLILFPRVILLHLFSVFPMYA